MNVKPVHVQCGVNRKCNTHAYVRVSIKGTKADLRDPIDVCRRHVGMVLQDFRSVSNDIHVRGNH